AVRAERGDREGVPESGRLAEEISLGANVPDSETVRAPHLEPSAVRAEGLRVEPRDPGEPGEQPPPAYVPELCLARPGVLRKDVPAVGAENRLDGRPAGERDRTDRPLAAQVRHRLGPLAGDRRERAVRGDRDRLRADRSVDWRRQETRHVPDASSLVCAGGKDVTVGAERRRHDVADMAAE